MFSRRNQVSSSFPPSRRPSSTYIVNFFVFSRISITHIIQRCCTCVLSPISTRFLPTFWHSGGNMSCWMPGRSKGSQMRPLGLDCYGSDGGIRVYWKHDRGMSVSHSIWRSLILSLYHARRFNWNFSTTMRTISRHSVIAPRPTSPHARPFPIGPTTLYLTTSRTIRRCSAVRG